MKGFILFVALALSTSVLGCSPATPTPSPIVPTLTAPTRPPATTQPQIEPTIAQPTDVPTIKPATPAPQVELGETKTYRDKLAGFEFDYPAKWNLTPVSEDAKKSSFIYSTTFYSWTPKGVSSEGIPAGETKIDVGIYKNTAASPEQALATRKQKYANGDMGQTILSEQAWTLPSGIKATRLYVNSRFGESAEVITALNGNTILFGGVGDYELFDAVAKTLRPL